MNKKKFCVVKKGQPQDPSWYLENDNAARDAAQLGFTNATGETLVGAAGAEIPYIPGIMTIYWAPSIGDYYSSGTSTEWKSNPFNLAMAKLYANWRRKNTASPVYQKTDLGVYIMSVDSLISLHAQLVKVYKIINYYRNRNKYTAKNILHAMGIDYDDIVANLADFGIFINNLAKKINNALSVPNLTVFTRHYWLNSHVWRDGDSVKCQLYQYVQYAFHKYNPTKTSDGGGTDTVPFYTVNSPLMTFSTIKAFVDTLVNPLITDDDILLISADCDKWYGGNQFFLPTISQGEEIEPEYSLEVLSQLQNSTIYKTVRLGDLIQHDGGAYISQDFGLQIIGGIGALKYYENKLLVAPYDNPTPEQILVMTRNLSKINSHTNAVVNTATLGSEVFIGAYVTVSPIEGANTDDINSVETQMFYNMTDDDSALLSGVVMAAKAFDMSPATVIYTSDSGNEDAFGIFMEYENYTQISYNRLKQIHNMALFSEFGFYQTIHLSER